MKEEGEKKNERYREAGEEKKKREKEKTVRFLILIGSFLRTDKFECRSADINVFWCQPFSPVSWSLW